MNIYIAGKITGLPIEEYTRLFNEAKGMIGGYGYNAINPIEICAHLPEQSQWADCMDVCLQRLLRADAIWLLPNWEESKGARIEKAIADQLQIIQFLHSNMLEFDPFIHH